MKSHYNELNEQYSSKGDNYYEFSRPEMIPFIPEGVSTVLEVGCSAGSFGALLKKERSGATVWGIEPSNEAASVAANKLDRVICGFFVSGMPELNGQQFDCIIFNDVLEHLVNPENALKDCKQYLSAGGVVVASIPNILHFYQILQILKEQDWKYEDSGILDNTHLRFFTKKSIVRMFEKAGFEILKIEGINASYGLKYLVTNLFLLFRINDWKYIQFAVQAKIADRS